MNSQLVKDGFATTIDLDIANRQPQGISTGNLTYDSNNGMGFFSTPLVVVTSDSETSPLFGLGNFYYLEITSPQLHSGYTCVKRWEIATYVAP